MRQSQWAEKDIVVVSRDPEPPAPGAVRFSVTACGICGSDVHMLRGLAPVKIGGVPGHEMVGTVLEGGAGLPDRLFAIEPQSFCGACDQCVSGRRHLCPNKVYPGFGISGGLADFVDAPRNRIYPVDQAVRPLVASLAEPLAVCVRAVHLSGLNVDSRVLVLGGGSIGLLVGLLARDRTSIVGITVRYPQQVQAARQLGLQPLEGDEATEKWASDFLPDVVIETIGGAAATLAQACRLARAGGTIIVLGAAWQSPLLGKEFLAKELTIRASFLYGMGARGPEFRAAVNLLPRYQTELRLLLTHQFSLDQIAEAFACASDKRSGSIKVTVLP